MTKKDTGNENRGTEGVGSESDPPQKKKIRFCISKWRLSVHSGRNFFNSSAAHFPGKEQCLEH